MLLRVLLLAALTTPVLAAQRDGPPSAPGNVLYGQFCAACHDHPHDRIPAREAIAKHTPEEVMQILTSGVMRAQAAGLNMNDRVAVTTFVTGKPPNTGAKPAAETNLCTASTAATGTSWNGWGHDLSNTRFEPRPGLTAAQVAHLQVRWAFGYRASYIYGQPTLVGGRLYATSSSGRVYSLDAKTGCTHWTFDAGDAVRAAVSVSKLPGGGMAAVFGDDSAYVYALDANTGRLLWKRRLDRHPDARITGGPVVYDRVVFAPVSSMEELSGAAPGYECCKFRGSVAALDLVTGKLLWQTYTIPDVPKPYRKSPDGVQLYGPAGGSVWSSPTIDPTRKLVFFGTGNSYTDVPAAHTDSVMALEMASGALRWVNQLRPKDNYVVNCETPGAAGKGACPHEVGPDADFGASPILRGKILLTGAKSGKVYGLDADTGRQLWQAQVGLGSALGGVEWGNAADTKQLYVAVSDAATPAPGGLVALDIESGKQAWRAPPRAAVCSWGPRNCLAAQSQAVSAMPGVVFSGAQDGHLRAYSSVDGRVLWDFDTAKPFDTVNGVAAGGGSLDNGGAVIGDGMVFVNSGYGRITGEPGNVLLAFGP